MNHVTLCKNMFQRKEVTCIKYSLSPLITKLALELAAPASVAQTFLRAGVDLGCSHNEIGSWADFSCPAPGSTAAGRAPVPL